MTRIWPLICLSLLPLASSPPAPVWLDTGHKVISLLAWEELSPKTRAKVTELLRQHPRYAKDLLADLPEGASDADKARCAFASAAIWPDVVRSESHPMHAEANHPGWHYIDIPYAIEGQQPPVARPSRGPGPHDVVEALAQNVAALRDRDAAPEQGAVALCWVLHLTGDIHQPLHACTLYSPQFQSGDAGGNRFLVLRDPPYASSQMSLHFLWDSLPGNFKSAQLDACLAAGLRADPRLSRQQFARAIAVMDFAAWAKESHELAVEYAYLRGELKGRGEPKVDSRSSERAPRGAAPGVPPGYLEQAEKVAMRQVVLAAYRTAALLNSIFDPR